ncbi:hypothetical protein [Rubellimicrobium sp. CFH 75288]|uniref:hypothetical protein n=1 Tax=Rubellimicrobium sp. CFH 75288 TaxID=2697034 RepID=UPI0014120F72|nr:hypothetical protein [Rubellimicrobium sp. CFH 75288]NAZ37318.1 hypothetical protein [Rubellimicrobium sp. CFH 75288]
MLASSLRYSLRAAAILAAMGAVAAAGAAPSLGLALVLIPAAGWPVWLALAQRAAIRRILARAMLARAVWWAPLLGGALGAQIAAVPVACLAAIAAGWWIVAAGPAALAGFAGLAAGVFAAARWTAGRAGAIRPFARLGVVLRWAPTLAALAATALWVALTGLAAPAEGSLAALVAAEPRYRGGSALLAWGMDLVGLLNGTRAWLQAEAEGRGAGPLVALWRLAGAFGQFWLLALIFAGCLPGRGETRRILRPSDADAPPPPGPGRVALSALLLTILALVLVGALARAEAWALARQRPAVEAQIAGLAPLVLGGSAPTLPDREGRPRMIAPALPDPSALRAAIEAERVGALTCAPGTIAALERIDRDWAEALAQRRAAARAATMESFDSLRARVPVFLDRYYSLSAEYLRTLNLLAGRAEDFLAGEIDAALGTASATAPLAAALEALAQDPPSDLIAARDRLLAGCSDLPSDLARPVVTAAAPAALLTLPADLARTTLQDRLAAAGAAGVAGGVAGAVVGSLLAKILAKEAVGLAAEALAKLAAGKLAGSFGGAAAGAGAGALAGSVVPLVGTAAGAVVGGLVGGLAIGVATDWMLLRLEEAVSREALGTAILSALDESEAEILRAIGG